MTAGEAVPGSIVVRIRRDGTRLPGLYRVIVERLNWIGRPDGYADLAPMTADAGKRSDSFSVGRIRLATEEEKREAGQ